MKNKKGLADVLALMLYAYSVLGSVGIINAIVMVIPVATVCVWHIPAWEKAKAAHCEAKYQAGDMQCGYKK